MEIWLIPYVLQYVANVKLGVGAHSLEGEAWERQTFFSRWKICKMLSRVLPADLVYTDISLHGHTMLKTPWLAFYSSNNRRRNTHFAPDGVYRCRFPACRKTSRTFGRRCHVLGISFRGWSQTLFPNCDSVILLSGEQWSFLTCWSVCMGHSHIRGFSSSVVIYFFLCVDFFKKILKEKSKTGFILTWDTDKRMLAKIYSEWIIGRRQKVWAFFVLKMLKFTKVFCLGLL